MQVDWKKILKFLDCPSVNDPINHLQHCPLHTGTEPTLDVTTNATENTTEFCCKYPKCGFSGNAINLISTVKGISLGDSANLFKEAGALHHTVLALGYSDEELQEYVIQSELKGYLGRCREGLFRGKGTNLRYKLETLGILHGSTTSIPDTIGVLVKDDIPEVLRSLNKKKYAAKTWLLYPYTEAGRITSIRIQKFDVNSSPGESFVIDPAAGGVFLEDNLDAPQLIIPTDESLACALYRCLGDVTAKAPAVVLPAVYPVKSPATDTLVYVSTLDSPFTLCRGLAIISNTSLVKDKPFSALNLYLAEMPTFTTKLELGIVHPILKDPATQTKLTTWILQRLDGFVEDKEYHEIYRSLLESGTTKAGIDRLVKASKRLDTSDELIKMLVNYTPAAKERIQLANGKAIRRTSIGLKAMLPVPRVLSNTYLTVHSKIVTERGEILYNCTVKTIEGKRSVTLKMNIPAAICNSGKALHRFVTKKFAQSGFSVYAMFYDEKDFYWEDIFAKLGESTPIHNEIKQLGADEDLVLNLPEFAIDTVKHKMGPQKQIFTLSPNTVVQYQGLRFKEKAPWEKTMQGLFQAGHKRDISGVIMGVCHVLYNVRAGLISQAEGHPGLQRHLFYVNSENRIWNNAVRQLNKIFSGLDYIVSAPARKLNDYFSKYDQLGSLPFIVDVPQLEQRRGHRVQSMVQEIPVSIIAQCDGSVANLLTDDIKTSFIVANDFTEQEPCEIHDKDIRAIQEALPHLIRAVTAKSFTSSQMKQFKETELPGLLMYEYACSILGVAPMEIVQDRIQSYYTGGGFTSVKAFFDMLHKVIYQTESKSYLQVIDNDPNDLDLSDGAPPEVFITQDIVYLSKRTVEAVNDRQKVGIFSTRSLSAELKDKGYRRSIPANVNIDKGSYWAIERKIWDKFVAKIPINLPVPVSAGKIIMLKNLAS